MGGSGGCGGAFCAAAMNRSLWRVAHLLYATYLGFFFSRFSWKFSYKHLNNCIAYPTFDNITLAKIRKIHVCSKKNKCEENK